MNKNAHNSTIHNNHTAEATEMPNRINSIYSHKGIMCSNENVPTTTIHKNIGKSHKHTLGGKSQTKKCILYDSIHTDKTNTLCYLGAEVISRGHEEVFCDLFCDLSADCMGILT